MSLGPKRGQARRTDPQTSHAAASLVRPGSARAKLLGAHARHPEGLTDEEAATDAGLSLQSEYATRCSELLRAGLLVDTTRTRPGSSGMARIVRRITDLGLDVVAPDRTPDPVAASPLPAAQAPMLTTDGMKAIATAVPCPACGGTLGSLTAGAFDPKFMTGRCRDCRREVQVFVR